MSKHTRGPWRWVPKEELPEDGVAILENLQDKVCDFGFETQYYPSEGTPPNEADRTLIAAAPDLLAACIQARGVVSQVVGLHRQDWGEATLKMLDEAIEKAGGR